ncbi:MAG TPA: GNAT family N-acetyltransferase, partial [Acidimicrobiales bacterium]|nr:GNAT family N-acetyltransferase [Acidimicrobiales bacterium]
MIARLAREEDKVALESFTCCDRSADYEAEVEDWVRDESWDWFAQGEEDAHLILFVEDESGRLLAVGAHESADWGRFINVLAVARDSQGQGIGLAAMVTLIEDCAQIAP